MLPNQAIASTPLHQPLYGAATADAISMAYNSSTVLHAHVTSVQVSSAAPWHGRPPNQPRFFPATFQGLLSKFQVRSCVIKARQVLDLNCSITRSTTAGTAPRKYRPQPSWYSYMDHSLIQQAKNSNFAMMSTM
jgi:hypothetical protein